MIVAIDGPAGAGKGTLGKRLAADLGYAHLDTGLLYRAVGARLLADGVSDPTEQQATAVARALTPDDLADPRGLRNERVGAAASKVAAFPGVRDALFAFQRAFATHPPDGAAGAVLDGRDIGTVICPDADLKLYLTASPAARARRRFEELQAAGDRRIYADILKDVEDRDQRDSARATAPLRPAIDAVVIDTTDKDAATVYAIAMDCVRRLVRPRSDGENGDTPLR
ncbi:MAG: (d)CMP kinase [Alphaproteobacteria bacterium]|nr:(d)CMP kinase [Alphaproteobacteria bacterium]